MGCHFLLQCMKVKSESEAAQSCPTLSDPMDYTLPGSSVHGIFQARVLEWGCHHLLHQQLAILHQTDIYAPFPGTRTGLSYQFTNKGSESDPL